MYSALSGGYDCIENIVGNCEAEFTLYYRHNCLQIYFVVFAPQSTKA